MMHTFYINILFSELEETPKEWECHQPQSWETLAMTLLTYSKGLQDLKMNNILQRHKGTYYNVSWLI